MKFRRALAAVATTAAMAPVALMTAPSALAADATPSSNARVAASSPAAVHPAAASGLCMTGNPGYRPVLHTTITGLPGSIAEGSGWHTFTLTIANPSQARISGIHLFAGVSSSVTGFKALPTSQVQLQAYFPKTKRWENVTDTAGHSVGYFGWGWVSGKGHISIPMRVSVKKGAPVGQSMALGAGFYNDTRHKCTAITAATAKVRITAPGRHTR